MTILRQLRRRRLRHAGCPFRCFLGSVAVLTLVAAWAIVVPSLHELRRATLLPEMTQSRRSGVTSRASTSVIAGAAGSVVVAISRNSTTNGAKIPPPFSSSSSSSSGGSVLLLHLGKAGGGTIHSQASYYFKENERSRKVNAIFSNPTVSYTRCHPHPCPSQLFESLLAGYGNRTVDETKEKKARHEVSVIINLRDPVDRFVSAFYWQQHLLCDPNGEEIRKPGKPIANGHLRYCLGADDANRDDYDELKQILFYRYNRSANALAQSLCSERRDEQAQARQDMRRIPHSQYSIADWFGSGARLSRSNVVDDANVNHNSDKNNTSIPTWWFPHASSIYPIVLEQPFGFDGQVRDAIQWAAATKAPATGEATKRRPSYSSSTSLAARLQSRHSSLQSPSPDSNHTLLPESRNCIARYYAKDYVLLMHLKDLACKTTVCKNAIESILDRRSKRDLSIQP